jgi:uncharacterized membrane protein
MSDEDRTANMPSSGQTEVPTPSDQEPVWTYRGYHLGSGEFNTAMVHFFRAEISRANVWRMRLDTTTNWAVVITAAVITFAFGNPSGDHSAILLSIMLVTLFLFIEARRYRYYELWSSRVRLMETDFYAAMLVPPFHPSSDWAESLAESLLQPHFSVSLLEAVGRRLRRNYLWIYLFLGISWFIKLTLFPTASLEWPVLIERAAIGTTAGEFVLIGILVFFALVIVLSIATLGLQEASGEVLPRFFSAQDQAQVTEIETRSAGRLRAWFRPRGRRKQLLALIITDKAQKVADFILKDMQRGVTSMAGKGMYTGEERAVLLCALTVTEVNQLKNITRRADPNAFVIVTPAHDILGKGFSPLETGG